MLKKIGGGTKASTLASGICRPISMIFCATAAALWPSPVRLLQSASCKKPRPELLRSAPAMKSKPARVCNRRVSPSAVAVCRADSQAKRRTAG